MSCGVINALTTASISHSCKFGRLMPEIVPSSNFVDGIHYPSCDGTPMSENAAQRWSVQKDRGVLMCRYERDPDVLVVGDVLIYPKQGQPKINVAPDILVAFGVPSKVLGLELRPDAGHVRFHEPATERDLRTFSEEKSARRKAEARVAELEAENRRLRGQSAR